MHLEYTPEEVRALVAEHEPLNYRAATAADVAEATDVLEGVEELISKLDPAVRRETLTGLALELEETGELWVPVANNCSRSAGVCVSPEGFLGFAVKGAGENLVTYFAARQAVAHALSGRAVVGDAGAALPAPNENGPFPAGGFADDATIESFAGDDPEESSEDVLDDALGAGETGREIGAVDFALKGTMGDEPSDLAADGLGYPAGISVRYLGNTLDVAAGFAPSPTGEDTAEEPELRPDWRERLEALRGELPADLIDDATALLEETAPDATPTGFFAELTRRRAAASLTAEDLDVHRRAESLGALEASEATVESGAVGRLASAGRAHLRTVAGELLLVPEGAPAGRVAEAARRSLTRRAAEREREAVDRVAALATSYLYCFGTSSAGGAATLESVLSRVVAVADGTFSRSGARDVLRELVREGVLACRRIGGLVLLGVPGAPNREFERAAHRTRQAARRSRANRKAAAARARARGSKAFVAPVVPYGEEANHLPALPERESGPDPDGRFARDMVGAERREALLASRGATTPGRTPRQRAAARRRVGKIVARYEEKVREEARAAAREAALACRAAWDDALSIHLASLPVSDRLELFLQLRGRHDFASLERSARDPEGLKLAARGLAEAGRVKVRRGRSSGKVFLEATEGLDREGLEKQLLKVMALAEPGAVEVPKGSRLARRVAAQKAALTRAANAKAGVSPGVVTAA